MNEQERQEKRRHAGDKLPSMKRRSDENNYHSRHIYMLTLVVEGRRPILGELKGDAFAPEGDLMAPRIVLSPLGQAVKKCWELIPVYHNEVQILALQIMPDHLHGILWVREEMEEHLGQVVSGFKAGCNKAYRTLFTAAVPQPTASPSTITPPTNQASPYAAAPPVMGPIPPILKVPLDFAAQPARVERAIAAASMSPANFFIFIIITSRRACSGQSAYVILILWKQI